MAWRINDGIVLFHPCFSPSAPGVFWSSACDQVEIPWPLSDCPAANKGHGNFKHSRNQKGRYCWWKTSGDRQLIWRISIRIRNSPGRGINLVLLQISVINPRFYETLVPTPLGHSTKLMVRPPPEKIHFSTKNNMNHQGFLTQTSYRFLEVQGALKSRARTFVARTTGGFICSECNFCTAVPTNTSLSGI